MNLSRFRKLCLAIVISLVVGIGASQSAWGGYEEGKNAFEKGDYKTALKEFIPLSKKGDVRAQTDLGEMYWEALGVPPNLKKAVNLIKKAANKGYARAQYNLGIMYSKGEGVSLNLKKADIWFRKSADKGFKLARVKMELKYEEICKCDSSSENTKVIKECEKGAEQGYVNAQYYLGLIYSKGLCYIFQDYEKAIKWFAISANTGHNKSIYELGRMHEKAKNYIQAHMWFNLLWEVKDRNRVEEKMTFKQILRAQSLAREWMEKHQKK